MTNYGGGSRPGPAVLRAALILAALAPIFLLTLTPAGGERIGSGWQACLVCGQVGAAAAILNLALFVPLGAALGLGLRQGWVYLLCAAALSVGIESVQHLLPGRNPTLGDIVFNTAGAGLGLLLARSWRLWLTPSRRMADVLALLYAGVLVLAVAAAAFAARPAFTDALYFGLWTPALKHLEEYDGVVRSAAIGSLPVPRGAAFVDMQSARQTVIEWETAEVTAVAGSRTTALAPLAAVFDEQQREILLIGIDRDDVVLRYRRRASAFRLMDPQLRFAGAARQLQAGTAFAVTATRSGAEHCLRVDTVQRCGLGTTVGASWTFLRTAGTVPASRERGVSMAWIALLCVPLGLWLRRSPLGVTAAIVPIAAFVGVPAAGFLSPMPAAEWLGAVAGVAVGVLLALAAARHRPDAESSEATVALSQHAALTSRTSAGRGLA